MSGKYPRTFHLPFSPGVSRNDKVAGDISCLLNRPIILTEKCDGSNASLELEGCFARTHAHTPTHTSFDALKAFHAAIKHQLPPNIQLFGENVYARHTIEYSELPGYFLLFGVRNLETNMWLSWDDVETWAAIIDVPTVPVLFKGAINTNKELQQLVESLMAQPSICGGVREGVVVRIAEAFDDKDFSKSIFKCVRANHINDKDDHWKNKEIIKNKLKVA